MEMQTKIRQVIASLLQKRGDAAPFRDSDSLILSGRLESIAVMEIAMFLESAFKIDFARIGFDPGELDTVDSIVSILAREQRPS